MISENIAFLFTKKNLGCIPHFIKLIAIHSLVAANVSLAVTKATFLPFVHYVDEATGLVQFTTTPISSFYKLYLDDANGAGGNQVELLRGLEETASDPTRAAKIILLFESVVMKLMMANDDGLGLNQPAIIILSTYLYRLWCCFSYRLGWSQSFMTQNVYIIVS